MTSRLQGVTITGDSTGPLTITFNNPGAAIIRFISLLTIWCTTFIGFDLPKFVKLPSAINVVIPFDYNNPTDLMNQDLEYKTLSL